MRRLPSFIVLCALLSACGRSSGSGGSLVSPERIIGTERLGWVQPATTLEALDSIQFVIYVDDVRSTMQSIVCGSSPDANGFPCSGSLPQMSPGRHTLRLAAVGSDGVSESPPSPPFYVIVVSSTISSLTVGPQVVHDAAARTTTTADRARLNIQVLLKGLTNPTDLAFLPDGRMLVAERTGSIRVVHVDRPVERLSDPALVLNDVETRPEGGLLALAADPEFDRNRYVYAVYTSARGFRLARFREAGDVLAERVILLDDIPASRVPSMAVLRFGPDAKLYLGLDDGGDSRRAGDLGSYSGKLLRLNSDATTPSDQAGGTPVYAIDVNAPRGLDWGGSAASIWIAQQGPTSGSSGELRSLVRPARDGTREQRARVVSRYLLPEGTQPSQIAIYRGTLMPKFQGDLFMAAGDRGGLLRVRFDVSDPLKVISTERLFADGGGAVRAIAVGGDGAIYFSTATTLMRIVPAAAVQ